MRRVTRIAFIIAMVVFFLAVGTVGFLAVTVAGMGDIPDIQPQLTSTFYDHNGEIITTRFEQNRFEVPLEQIPDYLAHAFIAVEDHRFYNHHGIDMQGLMRAMVRNVQQRRFAEGGSTITQQLARNLFLTHDKNLTRKAQEMMLTVQLERRFTKDEILENYLNTIYFGHSAYGVEAAARTYFGKSVQDLTLGEAAILAGIPRGPAYYSPYLNLDAAKNRQAVVLTRMVDEGYITEAQREEALAQELELTDREAARQDRQLGAYFINHLINSELAKIFPDEPNVANMIYQGGLHVYTTLDRQAQQAAENAVAGFVPETTRSNGEDIPIQAALVAMDPQDGSVRALVGGRDQVATGFNRAVSARRSPGSTFKMFTYAAALEEGYTPSTVRVSEPVSYEDPHQDRPFEPREFNNQFSGPLRMREAIARSSNVVAVKTHMEIGPEKTKEMAERLGITSELQAYPSLTLGGTSVTPLEMTTAYAPFANQGIRVQPQFVTKVTDSNGRILYRAEPRREQVLDARISFLMTDMMKSVLQTGTGRSLGPIVNRPAAGKTGTSQDSRDVYMVGYTPELVSAVWVGNDDNLPMPGQTGSGLAGPAWANFMREALRDVPARDFARPDGLVSVQVCPDTGMLHNPRCSLDPITEFFIAGTQPTEQCSWPECEHCPQDDSPWHWDGGWFWRNPFRQEPETPEPEVLPPDNGLPEDWDLPEDWNGENEENMPQEDEETIEPWEPDFEEGQEDLPPPSDENSEPAAQAI
ncbi:transglycosylase domain-containing protein [Dethiobacter alkaliphilus]|uniref:transglycosylase domain-containing protein n=1 Tax=Dethiobacter alkaliphilus TaxID=427926 RepID=UPI002226BFF6|nr:penicillin-binding protein 1A [Dethiobacter alkaliphilus]MCW3488903.1 penicillin-binding protein 1A [Dethiobacter alkaliphilus]